MIWVWKSRSRRCKGLSQYISFNDEVIFSLNNLFTHYVHSNGSSVHFPCALAVYMYVREEQRLSLTEVVLWVSFCRRYWLCNCAPPPSPTHLIWWLSLKEEPIILYSCPESQSIIKRRCKGDWLKTWQRVSFISESFLPLLIRQQRTLLSCPDLITLKALRSWNSW